MMLFLKKMRMITLLLHSYIRYNSGLTLICTKNDENTGKFGRYSDPHASGW